MAELLNRVARAAAAAGAGPAGYEPIEDLHADATADAVAFPVAGGHKSERLAEVPMAAQPR